MPPCKRGHEDAINDHASKDVSQSKKLRKTSDEHKQPPDDHIVETLCQRRLALDCPDSSVAIRPCKGRFVSARQTKNLSKLPHELVVEIAKQLKKVEDFICFRSISRSAHLYVKEEYFEGLRFRKSLPYLMLPVSSKDGNNVIQRRQFYSLVEGESIVASLEFPAFKTSTAMYFESLGWLLAVEVDGSMSLLDPFSDTVIPLPHIFTFPGLKHLSADKRLYFMKMVLSSRPNENSDFILMVIMGDCKHLAFWRLGDKAWNKIADRKGCFTDVVYSGGEQFYAISSPGVIWVINLAAGQVECRIIIDREPALSASYFGKDQYILKTIDGSVLAITRTRDKKFYLTNEFRVFDIDIERGTWKEINSLGSMAVFLGRNSSIAVDATAPSNGGVIKANHIYFTDDFMEYQCTYFHFSNWRKFVGGSEYAKGGSVDSGVFNFETRDVQPIYPVEPLWSNVCPAIWVTPNLCF